MYPIDSTQGSGALDQRHHLGRVTFANDFDLGDASFDVFKVAFAQADFERAHVLFEVTKALCAWNGYEFFSLGQDPGECQLRRRNALFAGQLFHCRGELQVGLQRILSETRLIRAAPIGRVEIIQFLNGAGQEPAAERAVRNKRDAQFAASRQHAVRFYITRPKRVLALQGRHRMDFRGAPKRFRPGFRQADRSDLARRNELGHGTNRFLDRNIRINAMLIIEVNRFDAQALKARVASAANIRGRTIEAADSVRTETEAKLGGDDDAIARDVPQKTP